MKAAVTIESAASGPTADARGRERILREARALFTAQGFAAVSMQQIADAASVNKATLYHHFRDKEDLFASVLREELVRVSAAMAASIDQGGNIREQLRRVGDQVIAERRSDFGRLFADMRAHISDPARARLMEACTAPWEPLRAALERAIQAGELREVDVELVARMYFVMVGSQIWWTRTTEEPGSEAVTSLSSTLTDLLLDGIRQPSPASDPSPQPPSKG